MLHRVPPKITIRFMSVYNNPIAKIGKADMNRKKYALFVK